MTIFDISKSPWLWATLAFLLGSTSAALMPRAWLFVEPQSHTTHDADTKEVWACPMGCVKLDGPGICPVCGMDLERLKDTGDTLLLNARERALIDLQTVEVTRRPLHHTLRTFGRVGFNQRRVKRISAWVSGRITRLFSDTVFTDVRQGDHLFEVYSPDLYATQSEYLAATASGSTRLATSARQKLLLLGFMDAQILALEQTKEPQHTMVIHSPAAGTIFDLMVKEGDYVKEGTPLYTIADYDTLWLSFDAYESELPWIAPGQDVTLTFESQPGQTFSGVVEFIDKAVNDKSRTVKVRVVLDNTDHLLSPGMFATVIIHAQLGPDGALATPTLKGRYSCYMHPEVHADAPGDCPICGMPVELHADTQAPNANANANAQPLTLGVPKAAILDTGARQLVYVMSQPPRHERQGDQWVEVSPAGFEAREVTLGPRGGDFVAVIHGLKAGERVATHGNFLIDSQMELLGKPSLLHPKGNGGGGSGSSGGGGGGSGGGAAPDPHAGH